MRMIIIFVTFCLNKKKIPQKEIKEKERGREGKKWNIIDRE